MGNWGKAPIPKAVEAAAGHIGQVERGGAPAAKPGRLGRHRAHFIGIGARLARAMTSSSGRNQAFIQAAAGRDPDAPVVEEGAGSSLGTEELVFHRIVDDAGNDLSPLFQADGYGPVGQGVQEVAGAVQGIDDPAARAVLAGVAP